MKLKRSSAEEEKLKEQIVEIVLNTVWEIAGSQQVLPSGWRSQLDDLVTRSVLVREPTLIKNYDVQVKVATTMFHRFLNDESGKLLLSSEYGVEREFNSVRELSEALVPSIECSCREFSHHVRVDPKTSFICILTNFYQKPMEYSCPWCPAILRNAKSLRWHLHHNHQYAYKDATLSAGYQESRNSTALVVYDPSIKGKSYKASDPIASTVSDQLYTVACSSTATDTTTAANDPFVVVKMNSSILDLEKSLIGKDASILRDKHGALLLHWAAGLGKMDLFSYLLSLSPSPSISAPQKHERYQGRTPLHWAARNGHVEMVNFILSNNACCEVTTSDGTTPFCWAAWQGHQDVLQLLYDYDCNVQTMNQFGCNAILWAAQGSASVDTMRWLDQVGCDLFLINHAGHGVLHKSAQRGRRDVCDWFVDELMARNQDSICKAVGPDSDGAVPSDMAAMEGYIALSEYLSRKEEDLLREVPRC